MHTGEIYEEYGHLADAIECLVKRNLQKQYLIGPLVGHQAGWPTVWQFCHFSKGLPGIAKPNGIYPDMIHHPLFPLAFTMQFGKFALLNDAFYMPPYLQLFLLLIFPLSSLGQHQQRELFVYNVSCGAIVGGVGAVINKPKSENWKKALARGIWQGSVGGTLNFCGKKVLYRINKDYTLAYAWPAKIIHDAGTSIVESAAANKPFLRDWHTDVGLVRLDFSINTSQRTTIRLLPVSLFSIVAGFANGTLDASKSVLTGSLCFVSNASYLPAGPIGYASGISFGRSLVYINDVEKYHTISHEMVHQFQFDEYQSLNSWLIPLSRKVKSESAKALFSKYVYFDIPYMVIGYALERRHSYFDFYQNLYEFEAESFSTNRYVQRH